MTYGNYKVLIDEIKDLKLRNPKVTASSLTKEEKGRLIGMQLAANSDSLELLIDSLNTEQEFCDSVVNFLKSDKALDAVNIGHAIRDAIINNREKELDQLIAETNELCCDECDGIEEDDDRCGCEMGYCRNCREMDYDESNFGDAA